MYCMSTHEQMLWKIFRQFEAHQCWIKFHCVQFNSRHYNKYFGVKLYKIIFRYIALRCRWTKATFNEIVLNPWMNYAVVRLQQNVLLPHNYAWNNKLVRFQSKISFFGWWKMLLHHLFIGIEHLTDLVGLLDVVRDKYSILWNCLNTWAT